MDHIVMARSNLEVLLGLSLITTNANGPDGAHLGR